MKPKEQQSALETPGVIFALLVLSLIAQFGGIELVSL